MILHLATLLFWFLVGHALADFPLQGEYLATAKRRDSRNGQNGFWFFALTAHALIHAAMVALALRLVAPQLGDRITIIAGLEFLAHWLTDKAKASRLIGMKTDQALHFASKFAWVLLVFWMEGN